jgi:hypothetical protein
MMKFNLELPRKRRPITADPNWHSQLTSEDFIRMFPDRAATLGMIPLALLVDEIPPQPEAVHNEEDLAN